MIRCQVKNFALSAAEYENIPCTTPCSLYSVFIERGYVDSAFVSEREGRYSLRGIKECVFVATVKLERALVAQKHVYLSLDKVMAKAEVLVNGKSFGVIDNVNRRFFFEIGDIVVEGDNEITLRCLDSLPCYEMAEAFEPGYVHVPDMGILGSVEISATNYGIIKNVGVSQSHKNGKVDLTVNLSTLGACADLNAMITLVSPVGQVYFGAISSGVGRVSVPDPILWWPHTMGAPNLYRLTVSLYHQGESEDAVELEVGLRELKAVKDESGELSLMINGRRMIAFGGEFAKENPVLPLVKSENTEALIKLAVKAKVNTFKAGFYEAYPSDSFYTLCDKYGIIVWQDLFINYETSLVDTAFVMVKNEEFDWVICSLSRHPSVIVTNLFVVKEESAEDISRGALLEFVEAAERIVAPIYSTYMPEGKLYFENSGVTYSDELSYEKGDIISIPELKTLRSFSDDSTLNPLHPLIEERAEREGAIGDMLADLSSEYRYAYDFESLIYLSQLAAARRMEYSVEKMRREGSSARAAISRRFNDTYPSLTSARVDFYLREKAHNYASRRFFSPVIPIAEISGRTVSFGVSCESVKGYEGRLTCALYTSVDKCVTESTYAVSAEAGEYKHVSTVDYSKYINSDPEEFYVIYELSSEKQVDYLGVRLFVPAKKYDIRDPKLTTKLSGSGHDYELTVDARALALGVCVSVDNIDARLSDNYFDLMAGGGVKIKITTGIPTTAEALEPLIKVRSLYELGR